MSRETPSARSHRSAPRRSLGPLLGVALVLVGLLAGTSGASGTERVGARPGTPTSHSISLTGARGYDCAQPDDSVSFRAGEHVTMTAELAPYGVTYIATVPTKKDSTYFGYGVPVPGVLRVNDVARAWRLALVDGGGLSTVAQLCLIHVSGMATPVVLFAGYSGGAHCCTLSTVYSWDASSHSYTAVLTQTLQRYRPAIKYDPNEGFVVRRVDGHVVLITGDGDFAYQFGCYACTPTPLHVYEFSVAQNRLVDVSSRFASVISSDATQLWRGVVANETPASQYSGLFGDLAAWVGEECTIDAGALAWRRVERLQREGVLSDSRYHDAAFVTRGSFVPALRSFLLSHGYCHGVLN